MVGLRQAHKDGAVIPIEDNRGNILYWDSTFSLPWRTDVLPARSVLMANTYRPMKRFTCMQVEWKQLISTFSKIYSTKNCERKQYPVRQGEVQNDLSETERSGRKGSTLFNLSLEPVFNRFPDFFRKGGATHSHSPWSAEWTSAHFDEVLSQSR